MCSGPVSCKAEDIAPIGTQRIHIHHLYTFIHSQPHRSQTYRVLTRTDGTNRLILVPSGRARARSISKNICLCTYVCIGINIRSIYTHTSRTLWDSLGPQQQTPHGPAFGDIPGSQTTSLTHRPVWLDLYR